MGKKYAPKTFLRQVCARLVNQITRHVGVDIDLGVELVKTCYVDESFNRLVKLPLDQRKQIEQAFAEITSLATPRGRDILLEEAVRLNVEVKQVFESARNDYERSAYMYLHHKRIFDYASAIHEVESVSAGRWCRRWVGQDLPVHVSNEDLEELRRLMQQSFNREGRGHRCNIDYVPRDNPRRHLFIAYPQDHASTELSYDEEGNLTLLCWQPVIELAYQYRPDDGVLEVLGPGGEKKADDLLSCLTTAVLRIESSQIRRLCPEYDLSVLKTPDLKLSILPEDGIERVILREVTLALPRASEWRRRVLLSADPSLCTDPDIHGEILRTLHPDEIHVDDVDVISAKFTFIFRSDDGRRGKRSTIVVDADCDLGDTHHDQIIKRCLRRWGLAAHGGPAPIPSGFRSLWRPRLQPGRHPVLAGPELRTA